VGVETRQLSDIAEIGRLFDRAGLDHWLFGGWAVDFYVGEMTRAHEDIDLAVWSRDQTVIGELLAAHGWQHAPRPDEDGGTGYERNGVRVELMLLVEGERGEVLIAFRNGTAMWSEDPLGSDVRTLEGTPARIIPLGLLRDGKSVPRGDPAEAVVDRTDYEALSRLPADQLG
jgi:Aminoglycoside-2''-adenylyltransferase